MTTTITLMRAHFEQDLSSGSDVSGTPEDAIGHLAGTEVKWAPTGQPSRLRSVRSWLTFWPTETIARKFLDQRNAHIPVLKEASDVLLGVLQPFATHGDVNWFSTPAAPLGLQLAKRPNKGAPVFVITSLGLGGLGAGAIAMGQGTFAIRSAMSSWQDVHFEGQILPDDPTIDGPTLSLWQNEEALTRFAYRSDPHKSAMKVADHADLVRGSFTRCVVLSFDGTWQGNRISLGHAA